MDYQKSLLDRIATRKQQILTWFARIERTAARGKYGGEPGRVWLDKHAGVGYGLNICCGDFQIGNSWGVDMDPGVVATDYWCSGDALAAGRSTVDYIVTNYLEALPNTRAVLREWNRVLVNDGIVAIVCRDSDAYESELGPFENHRRWVAFNEKILRWHLRVAGFEVFEVERDGMELRMAARKVSDA